ncbi:MAG: hypothetical protein ACTHLL_06850 [Candidatus Nitrosocosmicus sp.]
MVETKTVKISVTREEIIIEKRSPSGYLKALVLVFTKENISIQVNKVQKKKQKIQPVIKDIIPNTSLSANGTIRII